MSHRIQKFGSKVPFVPIALYKWSHLDERLFCWCTENRPLCPGNDRYLWSTWSLQLFHNGTHNEQDWGWSCRPQASAILCVSFTYFRVRYCLVHPVTRGLRDWDHSSHDSFTTPCPHRELECNVSPSLIDKGQSQQMVLFLTGTSIRGRFVSIHRKE